MNIVKNINKNIRDMENSLKIRLFKNNSLSSYENISLENMNSEMIKVNKENNFIYLATPYVEREEDVLNYLTAINETSLRAMSDKGYLSPISSKEDEEIIIDYLFKIDEDKYELIVKEMNEFKDILQKIFNYNGNDIHIDLTSNKRLSKYIGLKIRGINLNPFSFKGIEEEDLRFMTLILIYSYYRVISKNSENDNKNNLKDILKFLKEFKFSKKDKDIISNNMQNIKSYSFSIKEVLKAEGDIEKFSEIQGKLFKSKAIENPFQLSGFNNMELSTQLMLISAIQKGISFEILDENDQFVKFYYGDHVEYVKNANMTSLDTYISPLIMENKTVTKKVLKENGFSVPGGREYKNIEDALNDYERYMDEKIVIKPKSTNFGLGISVFQKEFSKEDYEEAIRIAFKEDEFVLVEEFIKGTEYRFYVMDGKVEGITLRVPANIEGDGIHTIEELVEIKNKDPLRGTNYRRPLQLIKLGEIEKLMLKAQGYNIKTILEKGKIAYLRENSNVSTGGDSIDMTDDMDISYKNIAEEAVKSLGAFISGIDIMIPDNHKNTTKDSNDYGIIEANFNPAIHMHMYPYKGKSRPIASKILDYLFPEI